MALFSHYSPSKVVDTYPNVEAGGKCLVWFSSVQAQLGLLLVVKSIWAAFPG